HIRERNVLAVGHIGVPALSGIAEPDRLAVRGHVGQHHHFGKTGLMELIGDVDLKLAEHASEANELLRREPLLGKAQHAVFAQRAQDLLEFAVGERLGEIDLLDRRAQSLPARTDLPAQSICAPDDLMIGAHFASSALTNAVAFCGLLPGVGSMPASSRRCSTGGSSIALLMASLSWSRIGCGVPAGARIAFQV